MIVNMYDNDNKLRTSKKKRMSRIMIVNMVLLAFHGMMVSSLCLLNTFLSPQENTDSGSAEGRTFTACGTLDYYAPEVVQQDVGQTRALDWWTWGTTKLCSL